jgi:hypothetical protein
MEPSSAGMRLLALGAHWSARRRPRAAALAYLTAANVSASGLSPSARAGALIAAAQLLLKAASPVRAAAAATADGASGVVAAVAPPATATAAAAASAAAAVAASRAALVKACLVLDGCCAGGGGGAEAAAARLHAAALLETACGRAGARARDVVADALDVLRRRRDELPASAWDWRLYWKARQVDVLLRDAAIASSAQSSSASVTGSASSATATATALANATATAEALRVAELAVSECVRMRDVLAAASFCLMQVQIHLRDARAAEAAMAPTSGRSDGVTLSSAQSAKTALDTAKNILDGAENDPPSANIADRALLRVCCITLEALMHLREGRIVEAKALQLPLMRAFDAAAKATRNSNADGPGQWKWQNGKVLRSLVQHVFAASCRNDDRMLEAWSFAADGLRWAGLPIDSDAAVRNLAGPKLAFEGKLPPPVGEALAIVLLDDAARIKLSATDLAGAKPLILAMLARVHPGREPGLPLATQSSVYLLAAEYHMAMGSHKGAETAAKYLRHIIVTANSCRDTFAEIGDIAQMAETYNSLLTGEKRLTRSAVDASWIKPGAGQLESDLRARFTNVHVRAAALFSDGVYELRAARVIEAKQSLEESKVIVTGCYSHDQLRANIVSTLVSLHLSNPTDMQETHEIVESELARLMNSSDLISLVRMLRVARKLLSRSAPGSERLHAIEHDKLKAENNLECLQSSATGLNDSLNPRT